MLGYGVKCQYLEIVGNVIHKTVDTYLVNDHAPLWNKEKNSEYDSAVNLQVGL